jgi:hypothetical protein
MMKNILTKTLLIVLSILTVTLNAQDPDKKLYISISHEIADYTSWKTGFDEHIITRQNAGIKDIFVKRNINNTNSITFFAEVTSLEKANAFLTSPDLKEAMTKAGVTSEPEVVFYKSATEIKAINTSDLVTTITHSVKDYSAWKDVYDSASELREDAGITDHLLLRSLTDENVVTVVGSLSSTTRFIEFMAKPELKEAMEKGGVTSRASVKVLL